MHCITSSRATFSASAPVRSSLVEMEERQGQGVNQWCLRVVCPFAAKEQICCRAQVDNVLCDGFQALLGILQLCMVVNWGQESLWLVLLSLFLDVR